MGKKRTGLHKKNRKCRKDCVNHLILSIVIWLACVWGCLPAKPKIGNDAFQGKCFDHRFSPNFKVLPPNLPHFPPRTTLFLDLELLTKGALRALEPDRR